jgi:CheY-like chemotaxis protein
MPRGGTLSFATDVVLIDDKFKTQHPYELIPGHYLKIAVSDSGTGMPQEVKKRIFEPFYTTKEVGKGTGMGLAAVYGTVKNHKGAINVYSEEGHGSVFNIYLPLAEQPAEKEFTEQKVIQAKGTPMVLLVDDEELVRNTAQEMLKGLGYRVTCCKDGKQAVDYYKKSWEKIDIVILDMIMPGLNGYDTFMAMRDINQDIKAIISSGFSDDEEMQKSLKEGVIVAIQKPFRISKLSQILTDVLDNKLTPRAMD